MLSLSDLRVRLEGRLEIIEETTDALEQAVEHLSRVSSVADDRKDAAIALALRLRDDKATIYASMAAHDLAKKEPLLQPTLAHFAQAKQAFSAALHMRVSEMGFSDTSDSHAIESLAAEHVVYRTRLVHWAGVLLAILFSVVTVTAGYNKPGVLIGPIATISAVAWFYFSAPIVIMTARRLCIGPQVVLFENVVSVAIATRRNHKKQVTGYTLTFEAHQPGGDSTISIPTLPGEMFTALIRYAPNTHSV